MSNQQGKLNAIREDGASQAVIFVHGFSGDRDDTWEDFPLLLGTHLTGWDIFTLGYATTLLPDVAGVWSADPDLPIIATMLRTHFKMEPLSKYDSVALVGHSMGGLVIQKALVDDKDLPERTSHVVLFGTPSAGLKKTSWIRFLKPQLKNMTKGSEFIRDLRADWNERFAEPHFELMAVAGSKDQFVPSSASLGPFASHFHYVVPGDHLAIVKPENDKAESFRLLVSALQADAEVPEAARDPIKLAAERPTDEIDVVEIAGAYQKDDASSAEEAEKEIVALALALERGGYREDSIALLKKHTDLGPDIQGALGGRMKRLWLEDEEATHAERSFDFYRNGLSQAQALLQEAETPAETDYAHSQIYYHAINLAFFHRVAFDEPQKAAEMAGLAVEHAKATGDNVWATATLAEAHLYTNEPKLALAEYQRMLDMDDGEPWQHASAGLQATVVASKLEDADLAESLAKLFTPQSRKVNKIFLSYSHEDEEWARRLRMLAAPYLRAHEELDLWVDTRVKPGDLWDAEIKAALAESGVAIALVSGPFLASDYIMTHEMPAILDAARKGDLRLLWVYVSYAAIDATTLPDFQAAHDVSEPLVALPKHEQDKVLLDVARHMKEAALAATGQYTMK